MTLQQELSLDRAEQLTCPIPRYLNEADQLFRNYFAPVFRHLHNEWLPYHKELMLEVTCTEEGNFDIMDIKTPHPMCGRRRVRECKFGCTRVRNLMHDLVTLGPRLGVDVKPIGPDKYSITMVLGDIVLSD